MKNTQGSTSIITTNQRAGNRLFCVDLLRGLDIFWLLVVHYGLLCGGVFKMWPLESAGAKVFWTHSLTAFATVPGGATTGFGLHDFTQPLFVFVTGVSASLAMRKFLTADGINLKAFWKRLASRMLMLWTCGSLLVGVLNFKLFNGPSPNFCFYAETLHTIAVAYFGASVGLLVRRKWLRLAIALALIAGTAAVLALCGDYTQHGNAARIIEEAVYSRLGGRAKNFCYLLTTFTWAGMGILASFAGDILKSNLGQWSKARLMALCGVGSLAFGWILSFWIPPIRFIYTASFVFETLGLSAILLAALYVVTDIWCWRRGTWLFILYGQCSLAAWMISKFFGGALASAAMCLTVGLPTLLGTNAWQPIFNEIAKGAILTWLVWQWRRLRSSCSKAA